MRLPLGSVSMSASGAVLPQDRTPSSVILVMRKQLCFSNTHRLVFAMLHLEPMKNLRVALRFTRLSDLDLEDFAIRVLRCMTGNPLFPVPAVPLPELQASLDDFSAASVASQLGGKIATAVKNERRAALQANLRRQAGYVQDICRHSESGMLSSGFKPANQNNAQRPLEKPMILKVLNEQSRQLVLRVTPIANARNYQVQIRVGDGPWQDLPVVSKARRVEVGNLTPGMVYEFRVRALGGSTGCSDWSLPVQRMSL